MSFHAVRRTFYSRASIASCLEIFFFFFFFMFVFLYYEFESLVTLVLQRGDPLV
jgi:hypothetical protein